MGRRSQFTVEASVNLSSGRIVASLMSQVPVSRVTGHEGSFPLTAFTEIMSIDGG
jgi:hypothetical protein